MAAAAKRGIFGEGAMSAAVEEAAERQRRRQRGDGAPGSLSLCRKRRPRPLILENNDGVGCLDGRTGAEGNGRDDASARASEREPRSLLSLDFPSETPLLTPTPPVVHTLDGHDCAAAPAASANTSSRVVKMRGIVYWLGRRKSVGFVCSMSSSGRRLCVCAGGRARRKADPASRSVFLSLSLQTCALAASSLTTVCSALDNYTRTVYFTRAHTHALGRALAREEKKKGGGGARRQTGAKGRGKPEKRQRTGFLGFRV